MFKKSLLTLFAALSLAGALTAQADPKPKPTPTPPPIQISSLPFTISAPGTYVLKSNLNYPVDSGSLNTTAINIPNSISGTLIIDLGGYTISSTGNGSKGIGFGPWGRNSNLYPITIRNGTFQNFSYGIVIEGSIDQSQGQQPFPISNVTLTNLTINNLLQDAYENIGILFEIVNSSTIQNCVITNARTGITDAFSLGGNVYQNITFQGVSRMLDIQEITNGIQNNTVVLKNCTYNPPLQ